MLKFIGVIVAILVLGFVFKTETTAITKTLSAISLCVGFLISRVTVPE